MIADYWIRAFALLALQHLWLGALLAVVALLVSKLPRHIGAEIGSWILAVLFAVAVVSPFAIFLPQGTASASSAPAGLAAGPTQRFTDHPEPVAGIDTGAIASAGLHWQAFDAQVLGFAALATWLAGFAWMSCRLWASWLAAGRLRRLSWARPDLERRFAYLLDGEATLRVSGQVPGPMLVGLLRPCVLLPEYLLDQLPPAELEFALRHELAHVRRRDPCLSLLQALGLAVFW